MLSNISKWLPNNGNIVKLKEISVNLQSNASIPIRIICVALHKILTVLNICKGFSVPSQFSLDDRSLKPSQIFSTVSILCSATQIILIGLEALFCRFTEIFL